MTKTYYCDKKHQSQMTTVILDKFSSHHISLFDHKTRKIRERVFLKIKNYLKYTIYHPFIVKVFIICLFYIHHKCLIRSIPFIYLNIPLFLWFFKGKYTGFRIKWVTFDWQQQMINQSNIR